MRWRGCLGEQASHSGDSNRRGAVKRFLRKRGRWRREDLEKESKTQSPGDYSDAVDGGRIRQRKPLNDRSEVLGAPGMMAVPSETLGGMLTNDRGLRLDDSANSNRGTSTQLLVSGCLLPGR